MKVKSSPTTLLHLVVRMIPGRIQESVTGIHSRQHTLLRRCRARKSCAWATSHSALSQRSLSQFRRYPCFWTMRNTSPATPARWRSAVTVWTISASWDSSNGCSSTCPASLVLVVKKGLMGIRCVFLVLCSSVKRHNRWMALYSSARLGRIIFDSRKCYNGV